MDNMRIIWMQIRFNPAPPTIRIFLSELAPTRASTKTGKWDVLKWTTRITENVWPCEPLMLLPNTISGFVEWSFTSFTSSHKLSFKLTTLQLSLLFTEEDAYRLCSTSTLHWHLTKTLPSGRRESQPITSQ
jgi:hypothetical protein